MSFSSNSFEYYMIGAIIIEKYFTKDSIIKVVLKRADSINGAELFINK